MDEIVDAVDWGKVSSLVPAVVQDASTLQVLMLGFMNEEALRQTIASRRVTFFSRSKQRLWTKGETSENYLDVVDIKLDCDRDTLLVLANPHGPTCHTGTTSCFGNESAPGVGFLAKLAGVIAARADNSSSQSYTASLLKSGIDRVAQKVGEEAVEVVIASKNNDFDDFTGESADLIYHLLVLLRAKEASLADVVDVLRRRHAPKPK